MKAVIFVLTALLAVAGKAHAQCSKVPQYSEKIDPVICPVGNIKLANYENAASYYECVKAGANGTLTSCPTDTYFNYATQQCRTCANYFPSTQCSSLTINVTCVPIATTVAPTAAPTTISTIAPTVAPTSAPTETTVTSAPSTTVTSTTEAPGESTTVPVPPTDAPTSTTTVSDDIITPAGTTISVPQPPSPNDSNVPTPVTPAPTAPVINDTPPTAAVADTV
ncbi:peritrophin-55 [Drosophila teissieri]|uniref:peritrophin-55 n=1 Tax=Drosophila teissieri TaxID=7243 RepID=UPI001CB9E387|nr:peritrophin-55 [Drosophila teissieri]